MMNETVVLCMPRIEGGSGWRKCKRHVSKARSVNTWIPQIYDQVWEISMYRTVSDAHIIDYAYNLWTVRANKSVTYWRWIRRGLAASKPLIDEESADLGTWHGRVSDFESHTEASWNSEIAKYTLHRYLVIIDTVCDPMKFFTYGQHACPSDSSYSRPRLHQFASNCGKMWPSTFCVTWRLTQSWTESYSIAKATRVPDSVTLGY